MEGGEQGGDGEVQFVGFAPLGGGGGVGGGGVPPAMAMLLQHQQEQDQEGGGRKELSRLVMSVIKVRARECGREGGYASL